MMQGLLAVFLLIAAVVIYFWGRHPKPRDTSEDPDVILGLAESEPKTQVVPPAPSPEPEALPVERIILFLRASPSRPFSGYELLQSLLAAGLRFGEMNFFHRYKPDDDSKKILFSVAAATKTGHLNPANMGNFACAGLSFFVTMNQHVYPSVNFELMLETARQLAEDLGGAVLDSEQKPLTQDKLKKMREKIKAYETSQQTMELFA